MGHSRQKTVGTHASPSPTTTPPCAFFCSIHDAYEMRVVGDQLLAFCWLLVGLTEEDPERSDRLSSSLFFLVNTVLGSGFIPSTLLIVVNKALTEGIPFETCCTLLTVLWNSVNGMPLSDQLHPLRVAMIASFPPSSNTIFSLPHQKSSREHHSLLSNVHLSLSSSSRILDPRY